MAQLHKKPYKFAAKIKHHGPQLTVFPRGCLGIMSSSKVQYQRTMDLARVHLAQPLDLVYEHPILFAHHLDCQ